MTSKLTAALCAALALIMLTAPAWAGPKDDIRAGIAAARAGRLQQAEQLFSKAINSGKLSRANLAIAYSNRGAARDDMGKTDQAIKDFTRATKADPKYDPAYYNRSYAYEKKKQLKMAYQDMRKALAILPTDPDYQQRLNYLMNELAKGH